MMTVRTDAHNADFMELVKGLDADLAARDGDDHAFYANYNHLDAIRHVVVLFVDEVAAACGALKEYEADVMEIKRMYTAPAFRNRGLASIMLQELIRWAKEMGYQKCILETGLRQPEAIALYNKHQFIPIPNYGQYAGVDNSVCFERVLK